MRPEDVDKMVDVVTIQLRSGNRIEVRAPLIDRRWLEALFLRNANPFLALRNMGYVVSSGK
jgi:hypothetical protein